MSDAQDKTYFEGDRRSNIRGWVLIEMLRGGGYAAVVLFGIGLILGAIYLVSLLLPPESKQAPPPMPFSQLEAPADGLSSRAA